MAIDCELIACEGKDMLLPPLFVKRLAAAGSIDIDQDGEYFIFNNLSTSQTVFIRLNLDTDNTAAATGDATSLRVEAGQQATFLIDGDARTYKLDVR
jgi:hypothetical protein